MTDQTDLTTLLAEHQVVHRSIEGPNTSCSGCDWTAFTPFGSSAVALHRAHLADSILRAGFGPVREVEAERDDLANRLSALLCDLTGGLMSKTNYSISTMTQAIEAEFEKHAKTDMADLLARAESVEVALATALGRLEAVEALCGRVSRDHVIERARMVRVTDIRAVLAESTGAGR